MAVRYRWLDFYKNSYYETECEVISDNGKTATIKLKGFGRNNTPPQSIVKCHLKSLIGYKSTAQIQPEDDKTEHWKDYNYFE